MSYKTLILSVVGVYSSSRSAQTRLSETLRLEMAPLGVRVVTVILGGVETSGNNPLNIPDLELPSNSHYQKITSIIDRHKKTEIHPNKQKINTAATNVVEDVLMGRGPFIRRGQASTLSWICNTFLPYRLFVWMINRDSALGQV
jgi:NAD(P)-dependent dehydrogenase (short-subunit alcohol dehydrogenase family)